MACISSFIWVSCKQNGAKEQYLILIQLKLFMKKKDPIKPALSYEQKLLSTSS